MVNNLKLFEKFFELTPKKNINSAKTRSQSNKLPSWFPHVPDIL